MDILGDSTLTTIQTPASVTADGSSAGVDARNLIGQGALIMTALKTAGTNPTLAIKLQGAPDGDVVTSVTPGTNTGNGTCTEVYGGPDAVAETITLTFSNATTAAVVGATSGALGSATVGTRFTSANISFMLKAGSTGWANLDTIAIITTERVYADVDGGAFTGLTTAASIQKLGIDFDKCPRYLRATYDIGGTNNPAYTVAIAAQSLTN
jgi:hypothetical protein